MSCALPHTHTPGNIPAAVSAATDWGAIPGHVSAQESLPFIEDFAGPGYFNDLDMMILGNMSSPYYGPSVLNFTEAKAHVALWAILKSPILLSCDVRSLSAEVLGLLVNPEMLAVVDDPLARQASRLQTADGVAAPLQVSFNACPPNGTAPLRRQTWTLREDGAIVSVDSQRVLSLDNCAAKDASVMLCGDGAAAGNPAAGCGNASCPRATFWALNASAGGTLVNRYNGKCLEGMWGFHQAVRANQCDPAIAKQRWHLEGDGTLRSCNQCLTAEQVAAAPAPPVEVYASPMADGSRVVAFFNAAETHATGTLQLSRLGWTAGTVVDVRDIFARTTLPTALGSLTATVEPHGVFFARLSKAAVSDSH